MKEGGEKLLHVFMPVLVVGLLMLTCTVYAELTVIQKSAQPVKTKTTAPSPALMKYDPNAPPKGAITLSASSKGNVNASIWYTGSYQYIQWSCKGTRSNLVDVTLWRDSQKKVVIGTKVTTGKTAYKVPWKTAAGQYELRVTSAGDSRIETRRIVNIVPTTLTITMPKEDENWYAGETYPISWQVQGAPMQIGVSLWELAHNKKTSIGTVITGENMTYTVPLNSPAGAYYLSVYGKDAYGLGAQQRVFILPPSVSITSPKSGDRWMTGTTYPIAWQFKGNPGPLKIELFNASNSFIIADNVSPGVAGSGKYDWKVIHLMEATYQVRITSQALGSVTSYSPPVYFTTLPPSPGKYVKWETTYCGNFGCNPVWQKPFPIKWSYNNCGDTIDITIFDYHPNLILATATKYFDLKKYPINQGPLTWVPPFPPDRDCGTIRCRQYLVKLVTSGGCEDYAILSEFQ